MHYLKNDNTFSLSTLCCVFLFLTFISCHTTRSSAKGAEKKQAVQAEDELMFGCYNASDTLKELIFYFPEEKAFYANSLPCTKEEVCQRIQYDISQNKGVKYYPHPESNFMYLMTIVREVKRCYLERIDMLSQNKFSKPYEELSPEQKAVIDSILSYRVLSE